jgi:hypothetical protein
MLAATVAASCIAFGIAAAPAGAAAVRSADTNLSDMTIRSVSNGYNLDDQNGTAGAGSIIVTDTSPGYDEGQLPVDRGRHRDCPAHNRRRRRGRRLHRRDRLGFHLLLRLDQDSAPP